MPNFNKVTADRTVAYSGSYGNAARSIFDFPSVGVMAADDVFYTGKVAKGSILTGLKVNLEAGIGAAAKVGYVMGGVTVDDYFAAAAAAGAETVSAAMPLECTDDCYIIITPAGTTAVDKRLALVVESVYNGEV